MHVSVREGLCKLFRTEAGVQTRTEEYTAVEMSQGFFRFVSFGVDNDQFLCTRNELGSLSRDGYDGSWLVGKVCADGEAAEGEGGGRSGKVRGKEVAHKEHARHTPSRAEIQYIAIRDCKMKRNAVRGKVGQCEGSETTIGKERRQQAYRRWERRRGGW